MLQGAVALFDMIEYYEAAVKINISCNPNISMRGWQACSRMIKKVSVRAHFYYFREYLKSIFCPHHG